MEKGKGTNGGGPMRNKKKMGWHEPLGAIGAERKEGENRKSIGQVFKRKQRSKAELS